jgi:hypothetical protein
LGLNNNYANTINPILIFDKISSNIFAGVFNSLITTNLYKCNGLTQFDSNICSGNGNCINNKCVCNFGYFGNNCELTTCYGILSTDLKNCSSFGNCIGLNNCRCFNGFSGNNCSLFTCNGQQSDSTLVCNSLGTCTGLNTCKCYNKATIISIENTCGCIKIL